MIPHGAPVDRALLAEVVRRVVEASAPQEVILFGTAACGQLGPGADLPLLIVAETGAVPLGAVGRGAIERDNADRLDGRGALRAEAGRGGAKYGGPANVSRVSLPMRRRLFSGRLWIRPSPPSPHVSSNGLGASFDSQRVGELRVGGAVLVGGSGFAGLWVYGRKLTRIVRGEYFLDRLDVGCVLGVPLLPDLPSVHDEAPIPVGERDDADDLAVAEVEYILARMMAGVAEHHGAVWKRGQRFGCTAIPAAVT